MRLKSAFISLIIFCLSGLQTASALEQENTPPAAEMLLNEPSSYVNHSVNVISGTYHENEVDMQVAGPHPLFFQRTYTTGNSFGNLCHQWSTNHLGYATKPEKISWLDSNWKSKKAIITSVTGDCKNSLTYQCDVPKNKKDTLFQNVKNTTFQKYLTNGPDSIFAAGSHIRNNRLVFERNDKKLTTMTGDGYTRHYKWVKNCQKPYELDYEEQPNGCVVRYDVTRVKKISDEWRKISLQNKEGYELSQLTTRTVKKDLKQVLSSDGKWVRYTYGALKNTNDHTRYLERVEGSDIPTQIYEYTSKKTEKDPKISRKNLPNGRFIGTRYYKQNENDNCGVNVVLNYGDPRINRVMLQEAPVGSDASPIVTHRYFYNLRTEVIEYTSEIHATEVLDGHTTVYDAHNHKTDYHFNEDFRLISLCRWGEGNAHPYAIERSFWAPNDTPNSTNLLSRTLANGQNEIKLCRSYSYDGNGNPVQNCLWGNLTGRHHGNIALDASGIPIPSSSECFVKSSIFSNSTPNLLLSESDGKKTIEYAYQSNTNLNTERLVKVDNQIVKREFKTYDDNGCLQTLIVDDGATSDENDHSSISERQLTCIYNRTAAPIGLPEIIEQKYIDFDTNQQVLLGRVVNTHSKTGKVLSQEHYDSENTLKFILEWEYDSRGKPILEKDALGRLTRRRYDQNGNLVYEEGPLPGVCKEYRYDFVNRLIGSTETHPDGVILTCSYKYDFLGNKISGVDAYGQETRYVYDHMNRLVQTILPLVLNEDGQAVNPTTRIEYDLFNNPCKITDAAGGVTTLSYTAYNKPYLKINPDGTTEQFEYDLRGNVVLSVGQNGTRTIYEYDSFDRLLKKEIYDANNQFLQEESSVYNAFHLLSQTDSSGITTYYEYNKAGRKTAVTKGEARAEYVYDTSGREVQLRTFYGQGKDEFTVEVKEYDLVNRVVEERLEDAVGNVLTKQVYEYDLAGNRTLACTFNQAGESRVCKEYNTRGQLVSITNVDGNKTRIHYKNDYYDEELRQFLPYSESTDPKGVVTVCIQDALGKNKTEYKKDPFGKLLQKRHYFHTQTGLLSRTLDEVIVNGVVQREIVNIFQYNSAGKLVESIESVGTPEQKIAKINYNSYGQKESEVKPDGTILFHAYDALGRLKEYRASDNSFHYVYEYDLSSNPVRVSDKIQGTETLKSFDEYNRLVKEILANGLSLEYSYDISGKPLKIVYPDGSRVGFAYQNSLLKEVIRIDKNGKRLYAHSYDAYDLSGNVTESTLIGKAGKMGYTIGSKGQVTAIAHEAWSGSILDFDAVGNITTKANRDALGSYSSKFNYDDLNQVTEESGSFSEQYVCDSINNRVKKGNSEYTLNGLNQVLREGENSYEYDLNGNLVWIGNESGETKLSYDALNRLIKVEKGKEQICYSYDEMNRRIRKTLFALDGYSRYVLLKTFEYFYQDLNEVGCFENGKLTELRLLGLGRGAEIGAAVAMELNDGVYAPIHDLHGHVICLIESMTGEVKEFYRYSAFGEETLYNHKGSVKQDAVNPWRFLSKRTDRETGFVYFGRRYYDSHLGRWITPDPIGFEGGPNLYAYVMNNPLTNIDLYGLEAVGAAVGAKSERSCFGAVRDFAHSVYERVRDGISRFCRSIRDGLSNFTKELSERFNPTKKGGLVVFNDRILASRMNTLNPWNVIVGSGSYIGVGFGNGIMNTEADNLASAEMVSNYAGGAQIISTVNLGNGFYHDVFRVFHSMFFNLASKSVAELHKKWDKHFAEHGLKAWLEICHSEYVVNMRNALMSYNHSLTRYIHVLAIAPACYIDKELCGSVHHYVSTRDFVPWFDVLGRIRNRETVHVLTPHEDAGWWDHDFKSPTYKRAIEHHIEQHIQKNGY